MTDWQPLTPSDIPAFVECLERYPLSMADEIRAFPMQYYTLRLHSPDAAYYQIPDLGYLALDPIGPHDAVVHFIRDPTCRAKKKKYLDNGKAFMLFALSEFKLHRLTLIVVEGSYHGLVPADLYAKLLGFVYEGTCRQARRIKGKFHDVHIFGVLEEK